MGYPHLLTYQLLKQVYLLSTSLSALDVFQALCSLDPSKASWTDSINTALLKYCAESLLAVHHLLTLSLRSQSLPQEWHTHCIVPVFKSGDNSLVNLLLGLWELCSKYPYSDCKFLSKSLNFILFMLLLLSLLPNFILLLILQL